MPSGSLSPSSTVASAITQESQPSTAASSGSSYSPPTQAIDSYSEPTKSPPSGVVNAGVGDGTKPRSQARPVISEEPNNFVWKLWNMVQDRSSNHVIQWMSDGTGFVVTPSSNFSDKHLFEAFAHKNVQNFSRQLSVYGFRKEIINSRANRGAQEPPFWNVSHPEFIRSRPDMLDNIKRKSSGKRKLPYQESARTPEPPTPEPWSPENNDAPESSAINSVEGDPHAVNVSPDPTRLKNALDATVASLAHRAVDPKLIEFSPGSLVTFGGYGDVQMATLRPGGGATAVTIAVKRLRPSGDYVQQLKVAVALAREIRVWSGLQHPNISPLVGFHLNAGHDAAWLLSPWEPNGNISAYLKTTDPSVQEKLQFVVDTINGLEYLHNRSPPVCHGDLKTANVLVTREKRAKLCDFGLARAMDNVPSGLTTTKLGTGTTRYACPELLLATSPRTLKSDIWSWGCLSYEIVSGQIPYASEQTDVLVCLAVNKQKLSYGDVGAGCQNFALQPLNASYLPPQLTADPRNLIVQHRLC